MTRIDEELARAERLLRDWDKKEILAAEQIAAEYMAWAHHCTDTGRWVGRPFHGDDLISLLHGLNSFDDETPVGPWAMAGWLVKQAFRGEDTD